MKICAALKYGVSLNNMKKKITLTLIIISTFVLFAALFLGTAGQETNISLRGNREAVTEVEKEKEAEVEKENEAEGSIEKPGEESKKDPVDRERVVAGRVAIIIDDLGYDPGLNKKIASLEAPVTLAVLPFLPDSQEAVRRFKDRANFELILHLPLQPLSEEALEERMGLIDMSREEVAAFLREALEEMEGAVQGLNNHKGSQFTSDPQSMRWLLEEVKERGLFFVDSRTWGQSVGYSLAQEMNIKTAERDVFLDVVDDPEEIRKKLSELEERARVRGQAVGIGHHKENTIQVLIEELPSLQERGIELVTISELIE